MGNRPSAAVASGVKNQGDAGAKELYHWVGLTGGGELVRLTKLARWTKNYKDLDFAIETEVRKFLYNGGKGKKMSIADLVQIRNKDREKSGLKASKVGVLQKAKGQAQSEVSMLDSSMTRHLENGKADVGRKYREIFWDATKRGTVGETILHLCLLSATHVHADLAKRILQFYPNLINEFYMGEEYYGETILHIAIVNEDPAMVKFLLDHGADYHARACGNFFCPDDQKDSRKDSLDHEWVDVCEKTNYEGYVYWGEYPLSFAACLGQEECARLLLAKGADPNLQDTNGNTALHMLVIHDKKVSQVKSMFDLIYSHGGRLDIKNRQGLTPLTLAAKLARKDMYEHVLEKERKVYWIYGSVTCAGYPLTDIDTISPKGEINEVSALDLIVYGENEGHLEMIDGLIVDLLQEKWKTFARFRFYRRFVAFIVYFIIFVTAFHLRPGQDLCAFSNISSLNGCPESRKGNQTIDPCYLLQLYTSEDSARLVLEIFVLLGAIIYLFLAMKEIHHQGFRFFFTASCGDPAKVLLLLSCLFVVMMLPGRAFCAYQYEDVMGVLAILCTAPYFLFFCRGFRIVGPFVAMIYKMIRGDLLRFFIIYIIFLIGFSQAMFIIFIGAIKSKINDPVEAVATMFSMSLGKFEVIYADFRNTRHPAMAYIIFLVYMVMVTLLLVNMLIAMMGNTYELVTNTQKEWFRQWAKIVLMIEQSVTPQVRLQQQLKYSQPMTGQKGENGRAFVVRWFQTEAEKSELARLKIQNKIQQRTMAQRKNAMRIINSTQRKLKVATKMLKPS